MVKESYPITTLVEGVCQQSDGHLSLNRFREYVTPLEMKPKGDVLIIGPGELMEEVALIEPEVASALVKNVAVIGIGPKPILTSRVESDWQYDTKLEVIWLSWGTLFDSDESLLYDTIIQIGSVSSHLPEKLEKFASRLRPEGCIYLTVNGNPPSILPELEDCRVEIIPNIPTNPNYNMIPDYFGVVVEKK